MKMFEIVTPVTGMTRPGQPPKPANTAQTQQAVPPVSPAANVSIGNTQVGSTQVNQQELAKNLDQALKQPTVSQDFAQLLAKVLKQGIKP
jgi:hypothetical protein